jgi:hypothetical protein
MEVTEFTWYACFLNERRRLNVRQRTNVSGAVGDSIFLSSQATQTRLFHGPNELGPRANGRGRQFTRQWDSSSAAGLRSVAVIDTNHWYFEDTLSNYCMERPHPFACSKYGERYCHLDANPLRHICDGNCHRGESGRRKMPRSWRMSPHRSSGCSVSTRHAAMIDCLGMSGRKSQVRLAMS